MRHILSGKEAGTHVRREEEGGGAGGGRDERQKHNGDCAPPVVTVEKRPQTFLHTNCTENELKVNCKEKK